MRSRLTISTKESASWECSPSDTLGAFDNLPIVHTDLVQQKGGHETGHASTDNTNLLVLFSSNEGSSVVLRLEVMHTVEPRTVWVIDLGKGHPFLHRR